MQIHVAHVGLVGPHNYRPRRLVWYPVKGCADEIVRPGTGDALWYRHKQAGQIPMCLLFGVSWAFRFVFFDAHSLQMLRLAKSCGVAGASRCASS